MKERRPQVAGLCEPICFYVFCILPNRINPFKTHYFKNRQSHKLILCILNTTLYIGLGLHKLPSFPNVKKGFFRVKWSDDPEIWICRKCRKNRSRHDIESSNKSAWEWNIDNKSDAECSVKETYLRTCLCISANWFWSLENL
jgi:hypothetical protein